MTTLLIFSVVLLIAVLLSELARRSVLSTAVLFLIAGFLTGGVLNITTVGPGDEQVRLLSELALFSVLYTDGMRVQFEEMKRGWRLPARALLLGMPLALVLTAILARFVVGLPWGEAFLLAAILSPTDPVLASAIVGREGVPARLRRLLNLESGLNDGLALPIVLIFLAEVGPDPLHLDTIVLELAGGVVLGFVIPYVAVRLEGGRFFSSAPLYEPLLAVSIGLLVLSVTAMTHANTFLGAFTAGVVLSNIGPRIRERFDEFGEIITELLKLAAILLFGALISVEFLRDISLEGYVFAGLTLVLVRPVALGLSLLGTRLNFREWAAAAWFGPKGFASVVFALLVVVENTPDASRLFHLAALVVALSILVHSTTDILIARYLPTDDVTDLDGSSRTSGAQPSPQPGSCSEATRALDDVDPSDRSRIRPS